MLELGGSTVDAAIAAMLCDGVYHMHSTGLFGSSFMLIYERLTLKAYASGSLARHNSIP